jgi:hypothetical protein
MSDEYEQTGQVRPDKDVDQGVWSEGKKDAPEPKSDEAPASSERTSKKSS